MLAAAQVPVTPLRRRRRVVEGPFRVSSWTTEEGCLVSHHAADRWITRIGKTTDTWSARAMVQAAFSLSIQIPNRLASERWVPRLLEKAVPLHRRLGFRFHVTGHALLLASGKRVITVLALDDSDVATIFVWLMFGQWVAD